MGHLNTRHYVAMFDDAHHVALTWLGYSFREGPRCGVGWVDVRNNIDYLAEVEVGTAVEIETQITRLGTKSITFVSEMRAKEGPPLRARMTAILVYFDLSRRVAIPIPEGTLALARDLQGTGAAGFRAKAAEQPSAGD
jgi:acyl-CoA thioester hydrolase